MTLVTDLGSARVDVCIVGTGFSGLAMLQRVLQSGRTVVALEAGGGVGGTWYWNRYPGARCDVPSLEYSYSFSDDLQQEWNWSEKYATQGEILAYLNHVADRFDLRPHIRLNTRVAKARFDEQGARWHVEAEDGRSIECTHLVMAVGCLSAAQTPDIPGIDAFNGRTLHTGAWPHEPVSFSGESVAVIGTGSSGTQVIPILAQEVDQLTVFQRTPNWTMPARNAPLSPAEEADMKAHYQERRAAARSSGNGTMWPVGTESALAVTDDERLQTYEKRWQVGGNQIGLAFADLMTNDEANRTLADFVRAKIRDLVEDEATFSKLDPGDLMFGARRGAVGTHYYETFNRDNVSLVDVREDPIEQITEKGIATQSGERTFDSIIFATGFDAMTGALNRIDIRGRNGQLLRDVWAEGPQTYLGIAVHGFPNMFIVAGPGSPSVLSNVVVSAEQHVGWLGDYLDFLASAGISMSEAGSAEQTTWTQQVTDIGSGTILMRGNSWYLGANTPGKPRVFMPYAGGVGEYRRICEEVRDQGYTGFQHVTLQSGATTGV